MNESNEPAQLSGIRPYFVAFVKFCSGFAVILLIALITLRVASAMGS